MTHEEYNSKFEMLRKQQVELGKEFVKKNPFNKLKGKIVNLTIGRKTEKVLFVGVKMSEDIFGKPFKPALYYYRLKMDGTPRKDKDCIPLAFYDERDKIYKIEKI